MKTIKPTPAIEEARQKLLAAQTRQSRFDITIAIEGLIFAMLEPILPADMVVDKTGETCVEEARRLRRQVAVNDALARLQSGDEK